MEREWISVGNRLPGKELVLVCNEEGDRVTGMYQEDHRSGPCWRIGNDFVAWDFDFNYDYEVAFWMPLPDAPTK